MTLEVLSEAPATPLGREEVRTWFGAGLVFGQSSRHASSPGSVTSFSQLIMKLLPRTLHLTSLFLLTFLCPARTDRSLTQLPILNLRSPNHPRSQGEYLRDPEFGELLDVVFRQVLKGRHQQVTTHKQGSGPGESSRV